MSSHNGSFFYVQGKHKGLVKYNKNHNTSILKKHACCEHPNLYQKMGIVFVVEGYRNPKWKIGYKEEDNCPPFSNHRLFWLPMALPQITFFPTCLFGRLGFLCCKGLRAFFLLKIHGCSIWFCGSVGMYNFHPIIKWWLKCS
jgi:hypothetical protein